MALRLRLARGGSKKRPFYSIVVAQATSPRDGRFVEKIGYYNPLLPKDNSSRVVLQEDRARYWLSVGALPSERVAVFLDTRGLFKRRIHENPKKAQPKAKAQARVKELEEKRLALEEAAREQEESAKTQAAEAQASDAQVAETQETETQEAHAQHETPQADESAALPDAETAENPST